MGLKGNSVTLYNNYTIKHLLNICNDPVDDLQSLCQTFIIIVSSQLFNHIMNIVVNA